MSATDANLKAMQNDMQTKQQRAALLKTKIRNLKTAIDALRESQRNAREGVVIGGEGNAVNRGHEAVKVMVTHTREFRILMARFAENMERYKTAFESVCEWNGLLESMLEEGVELNQAAKRKSPSGSVYYPELNDLNE